MCPVRMNMTGMSRLLGFGEQDPAERNVDRISSLPPEILNKVFGKLTIVEAVRTSVLAKDWRHKWLSSSEFSLDSRVITCMLNHENCRWDIIASVVSKYLLYGLHHTSAIKGFSLKPDCSKHYPDMCQWIESLSTRDVEMLSIRNLGSSYFIMSWHLFSFKKLKVLSLACCALRVPSTFGRFVLVEDIRLQYVSISEADLARLNLCCPLLEFLTLSNIFGSKRLKIHAPRLTRLLVDTGFEDIVIDTASTNLCVDFITK